MDICISSPDVRAYLGIAATRHRLVGGQPPPIPNILARPSFEQPGTSVPSLCKRGQEERAAIVHSSTSIHLGGKMRVSQCMEHE